ncbi:HlyD family efflux transporter periplasmic adaptor subunit [uncultured Oscillibacter sp.]|uniref:HlyD family efflux transporter periplasmic adaptor subunit n=1 Tax=uncultured Oscillibacter sp. TaxID=876091 RepID=UPI0025EE2608|nr:HlyD family efflux transporter periplasmic adaptor subunit [uncultured Oscillibacter sp.]
MKQIKSSLGTKLLMLLLFLGVSSYFVFQAIDYLDDPLSTTLAYRYQVETTVDLTGYVVREERVLEDDSGGLLRIQRREGERVAAGGTVASVYADQASLDRQAEIDSLESRVEQLQYAQDLALAAETTRKLDAQIIQNLLEYRRYLAADRLYDAESTALELRALVLKRDYTGGDSGDVALQLQELGARLLNLRSQAEGSVRRITAPVSGLYSSEVDGFESVLTPEMLKDITPFRLASVQAEPTSSRAGKLVLGEEWYFTAVLPAEEAAALYDRQERGREALLLRFSKGVDRDLPVTMEPIGASENGRVAVVFRGRSYLQELTLLRQQRAQVITGSIAGIRIPRESLRAERAYLDEKGETAAEAAAGVYCIVGREVRFKPVEILYSGDSFVLVRSAGEKESQRLRPGEQIIVSARGLYDGKVLQ